MILLLAGLNWGGVRSRLVPFELLHTNRITVGSVPLEQWLRAWHNDHRWSLLGGLWPLGNIHAASRALSPGRIAEEPSVHLMCHLVCNCRHDFLCFWVCLRRSQD